RVRNFLNQLAAEKREQLQRFDAEQARILAALFSGSQALSAALIQHADWLSVFDLEVLRTPRREQGLRREVNGWLEAALERRDFLGGLSRLRLFQQRELLRVGARDLARLSDAVETTFELSN